MEGLGENVDIVVEEHEDQMADDEEVPGDFVVVFD